MDVLYVVSSLKSSIQNKLDQLTGKKENFSSTGSGILVAIFGLLWLVCISLIILGLWIRLVLIASKCSALEGLFAFFCTSLYCFYKLGSLIELNCKPSNVVV